MMRQRTIVGFGAAYLAEHPDHSRPAGLAAELPLAACRLHHRGVTISRVGQDRPGDELLAQLRQAGVDTSHVQSDPDLPTGRVLVRRGGAATTSTLATHMAFDNVNWDFDLEDVSQQADAIVFDHLCQRYGQTRSVLTRLLEESPVAVRVFDLTQRVEQEIDRVRVASTLQFTDGLLTDDAALRVLSPASEHEEAARKLLRSSDLSFVAAIGDDRSVLLCTRQADPVTAAPHDVRVHYDFVAALLHGLMLDLEPERCVALASSVAEFASEHRTEPVPESLLEMQD